MKKYQFVFPTPWLCVTLMCALSACTGLRTLPQKQSVRDEIRPGDAVDVKFDYYPDLNQTFLIPPDGKVWLKAVGELKVVGLAGIELQAILRAEYGDILAMPNLSVDVRRHARFAVYVTGQIKRPGIVKYERNLTVARGILLAGGLKVKASSYDIYVFRSVGEKGLRGFKIEWSRHAGQKGMNKNFKLAPFDIVYVMPSPEAKSRSGIEI